MNFCVFLFLVVWNDPNNTMPDGWNVPGDYVDVVHGEALVRWQATTYGGVV